MEKTKHNKHEMKEMKSFKYLGIKRVTNGSLRVKITSITKHAGIFSN
jgi:hypothetical protein